MSANWRIGDRIKSRWEILDIRRGGLGIVYIVKELEGGDLLAFKTFQDVVFTLHPETAERFMLEALAWINLDVHRNITQARFVEIIEDKPYIKLEYVSGGDLGGWIGTPRLTEDLPQVLRFALQFCDGMAHALSKGIKAHRDIKPQNCLITSDRTLKVTDFGLAKVFDDAFIGNQADLTRRGGRTGLNRRAGLTRDMGLPFGWAWEGLNASGAAPRADVLSVGLSRTGVAAGTVTHMAPEQFDDAKHVDVRADIYSFGVMLFQMLTGSLPFGGRSRGELEHQHKTQPPPMLMIRDGGLRDVLEQCLAKEPCQRFEGFGGVRTRLAEAYKRLTGLPAPQPASSRDLSVVELVNKGLTLEKLGRVESAIECYDRALNLNPPRGQAEHAWYNKGLALRKLGRTEESLACYDRALEINPRFDAAWNNKGNALSELGRTEEAITCYERALAINPNHEFAWNNKGTALMAVDRTHESLECYERALEQNPRHKLAWTNKGRALAILGRREDGIKCFDRALELNPRDDIAWTQKAAVLWLLNRVEEAVVCYERALRLRPRDEQMWLDLALALERLGRTKEVINSYERVLEINPRNKSAWLRRGEALGKLGRAPEAIDSYNHVLEIDRHHQEAWNNKGIALETLGRAEEAIACHDYVLSINPRNVKAWANKGWSLLGLERANEALACFERALEIDPGYGYAWVAKGVTLASSFGQFEYALTCFDRALEVNAHDEDGWNNKGEVLKALGRAEESAGCFERALEINPRSEKAWFNKGTLLFRSLRRYGEALRCLEEARRLGHARAEQEISHCRLAMSRLDNHS